MLITLSAKSLARFLEPKGDLSIQKLPAFVHDQFEIKGMTVQTCYLKGQSPEGLDRLRDAADKAGCPWLAMVEEVSHNLSNEDEEATAVTIDRMERVLRAAGRLGCSSVAMSIADPGSTPDPEFTEEILLDNIRRILTIAEQLELNLLISPSPGITQTPEGLTGLIRRVGGFRIGSYPDFEAASAAADPGAYLRTLVPYAAAVTVATTEFGAKGKHKGFDLSVCLEAVKAVGFDGNLSIEFRGEADPIAGIRATHEAVLAAMETAA